MDSNEGARFGNEGPRFAREDEGADVEGHIRPAHTVNEGTRQQGPVEAHEPTGEDDGPDVEGHGWKF